MKLRAINPLSSGHKMVAEKGPKEHCACLHKAASLITFKGFLDDQFISQNQAVIGHLLTPNDYTLGWDSVVLQSHFPSTPVGKM